MLLKNRVVKKNTFFFLIYQQYKGIKASINIVFHIAKNIHV